MSSYVILELDTTPPIIEMYAPRYTTSDTVNVITIESNESLAEYQDIYVIDANGDRHDFTFYRESNTEYVGAVRFNNIPTGIVEIFARMKDDVDNFSNVVSATIEVKNTLQSAVGKASDSESFSIDLKESDSHFINIRDNTIITNVKDETRKVNLSQKDMNVIVSDITMKENLDESQ
jgi:hypothetical protein